MLIIWRSFMQNGTPTNRCRQQPPRVSVSWLWWSSYVLSVGHGRCRRLCLTSGVGLYMRSFDATTMMFVCQQLATELPSILTLMGSIVVAGILWRRAPSSSLFVGLACGLSLVLLILYPVAWQVARHVTQGDPQTARKINIAFAVFWSLVR